MLAVFIFAAVLLIYYLEQRIYADRWHGGLDCTLSFRDKSCCEGDTSELVEVVCNRKRLPLIALQVKFAISRYLDFDIRENTVLTDKNYRNDIFSLSGYEKITRVLPFTCTRRGYYSIDTMELISGDLFMDRKLISVKPQNTSMYVYPGSVDTDRISVPFRHLMGAVITRRYNYQDPFEFRGIREYDIHDPMRDINWKVSARADELMSNMHDYTANQQVVFLLDTGSDTFWDYDELLEESIRIAASLAQGCLEKGVPVELVTNGSDCITGGNVHIQAGAGPQHQTAVLQGLSRIERAEDTDDMSLMIRDILSEGDDSDTVYVLISRESRPELMSAFNDLCSEHPGSMLVAPLHPDMDGHPESCPEAVYLRWEVPYVR